MTFTELLQTIRSESGASILVIPDDWLQGRSAFGGLQAALAVHAMRALVPANVPLRTLQVTFIAPVPAGEARAQARVLRTGKSATHVEARLVADDEVLAVAIGVFGSARPSVISHMPQQDEVRAPDSTAMPFVAGISPSFTQHFGARWLRGGLPFSGNPARAEVVELDFCDAGTATEAHLIAIADFIPPVALSMLPAPTAGSSMTWMLELTLDRYEHLALQGWRIDAQLIAARDGYTSQSTLIWTPQGQLAAISTQAMVVFG